LRASCSEVRPFATSLPTYSIARGYSLGDCCGYHATLCLRYSVPEYQPDSLSKTYDNCTQQQLDRLTHVQLLFTWNLAPLQPSRFSLEYLLLPPRSAPTAAPSELTLKTLQSNTVATFLPVSTFITPFPKKKCVIETVRYGPGAQTLSIFRASESTT
ncbi:conserved hypothetical protein, partial [Trichinella spiralis]|uniref:hypothetical protein n=1 Tax=Trichinella spiralis TaxID=6334 RepID=UPI0001EFE66F